MIDISLMLIDISYLIKLNMDDEHDKYRHIIREYPSTSRNTEPTNTNQPVVGISSLDIPQQYNN